MIAQRAMIVVQRTTVIACCLGLMQCDPGSACVIVNIFAWLLTVLSLG